VTQPNTKHQYVHLNLSSCSNMTMDHCWYRI